MVCQPAYLCDMRDIDVEHLFPTAPQAAFDNGHHVLRFAEGHFQIELRKLRLSVGARDLDVLMQFLVEAVVLSLAGGALGVALGIAASYGISSVMQWSTVVTPAAVLLSFGCAAASGIFFGFYPARKAAARDPIDALRFE